MASNALTIHLLHGVVHDAERPVRNYTGKHLSLARFGAFCHEQLRHGTPVDPETALAGLRGEAELPYNAFLFTFDDGFRNNLTVAAPIMQELGIGAIFYVTTRFVDEDAASWIDLIEDAVDRTQKASLRFPWGERDLDDRRTVLDEVRAIVKSGAGIDPYELAEHVMADAGTGDFRPDRELDAKLTWDEVRALDALEGFTVGGHSHTHRILTQLTPDELDAELDRSLELLQRHLRRPIEHYSYPEGLAHCYDDAVIAALQTRGIVCCPTAEPGTNRPGDDLFRLRRNEVR